MHLGSRMGSALQQVEAVVLVSFYHYYLYYVMSSGASWKAGVKASPCHQ